MTPSGEHIKALADLARLPHPSVPEMSDAERRAPPGTVPVTSPGTGTFLPTHPACLPPGRAEGGAVAAGAMLGLVASGRVCRPVLAPCDGTLLRCLQPAGALVDVGTALFAIIPARKDQT